MNEGWFEGHNPNCDGDGACTTDEVRVLPLGAGGNLILCRRHVDNENAWRRSRKRELSRDVWYDEPKWESLEVYGT